MSKMMSALLSACAWAILLGVIVAAITRVSIEAIKQRNERNSLFAKFMRRTVNYRRAIGQRAVVE
jgi:hypothetical protein